MTLCQGQRSQMQIGLLLTVIMHISECFAVKIMTIDANIAVHLKLTEILNMFIQTKFGLHAYLQNSHISLHKSTL